MELCVFPFPFTVVIADPIPAELTTPCRLPNRATVSATADFTLPSSVMSTLQKSTRDASVKLAGITSLARSSLRSKRDTFAPCE